MAQLEVHTTGDTTQYKIRQNTERLGQTFEHDTGFNITSVKLKLYKEGTPGTNLVVSIYATAGGEPTGSALVSANYATSGITTSSPGEWYEVTISLSSLPANTQYAIVLGPDQADWGWGNYVDWRQDPAPAGYSNGHGVDENAGFWDTETFDYMFEVWGTEISPLPGKPTNPTPSDEGTDIKLSWPTIAWESGS